MSQNELQSLLQFFTHDEKVDMKRGSLGFSKKITLPVPIASTETWIIPETSIGRILGLTHRSRFDGSYNELRTTVFEDDLEDFCGDLINLENMGATNEIDEASFHVYWIQDTAMILFNDGGNYQCCLTDFGGATSRVTIVHLGNFNAMLIWLKDFGITSILRYRSTRHLCSHRAIGSLRMPSQVVPAQVPAHVRGRS